MITTRVLHFANILAKPGGLEKARNPSPQGTGQSAGRILLEYPFLLDAIHAAQARICSAKNDRDLHADPRQGLHLDVRPGVLFDRLHDQS